jgi:hypothetical protein
MLYEGFSPGHLSVLCAKLTFDPLFDHKETVFSQYLSYVDGHIIWDYWYDWYNNFSTDTTDIQLLIKPPGTQHQS